jgi:hypothetical protein
MTTASDVSNLLKWQTNINHYVTAIINRDRLVTLLNSDCYNILSDFYVTELGLPNSVYETYYRTKLIYISLTRSAVFFVFLSGDTQPWLHFFMGDTHSGLIFSGCTIIWESLNPRIKRQMKTALIYKQREFTFSSFHPSPCILPECMTN